MRATVLDPSRVVNTLSTPRMRTTGAGSGVGRSPPLRRRVGVPWARSRVHPGRPRSTMISATRITRKNAIPSTPATKIAAHSFSGPVA